MSRLFVTGGSGCVGANLIKRLAEQGHEINALIFPNTWHPFLDGLKINVFYGDITKMDDVKEAMRGCEYVYQVAGIVSYNLKDHKTIYNVHVLGVWNVLKAAKELDIKKVVVTASTAGIGIPENKNEPLNEDAPFDFRRYKKVMYMYSKHLGIKLCKKFAREGLNVSMVSPTTIYGQGDITMHVGKVVKKIKEGKLKRAPPGGNAVMSVDDAIDAHLLVMEKGRSGENYIFANEFISYKDMFNRIAKLVDGPEVTKVYPRWILGPSKLFLNGMERAMLVFDKKPILSQHSLNFSFKHRYFDSSKAKTELGWEPKVSFEQAIQKAVDFYKEHDLI